MSATVRWRPRTARGSAVKADYASGLESRVRGNVQARFGEGRLETCRKVMRWPPTLPVDAPSHEERNDDTVNETLPTRRGTFEQGAEEGQPTLRRTAVESYGG